MKNTDILVKLLRADIENKMVLEVACGAADFSVSASAYSDSVYCIDLDARRLNSSLKEKLHFQIMDASKMDYADDTFDTIIQTVFKNTTDDLTHSYRSCFGKTAFQIIG